MSGFMFFIFFVTLIAFIVYWRKKANARKNAGDNYKDDPVYQKISKTKRIIGAVCIVSLLLGFGMSGNSSSTKNDSTKSAQVTEKAEKSPEEIAAEKAKQEEKKKENMVKEITTGWDTATQKYDDHKNIKKALELIKKYPDYIPNQPGEPLNTQQAMQKPWDFYGKVVTITGTIYNIQHYPPDHAARKFIGQECFNAMIRTNDGVYVSVDVVGNGNGIQNNAQVSLKGYVIGLTDLQDMKYGGKSDGLGFVAQQ